MKNIKFYLNFKIIYLKSQMSIIKILIIQEKTTFKTSINFLKLKIL